MIFCLSTVLRKVKPLRATITWHYSVDRAQKWRKTASDAKEKSAVPPRQWTLTQIHDNDGQIEWIKLRIASSPTIFSRSGPQRLMALCWPEIILQGKRFGSNEELIAETEAYFESKDESFYKKGIEKLEKRWNECITLEGNYVDEWSQISRKNCVFLS